MNAKFFRLCLSLLPLLVAGRAAADDRPEVAVFVPLSREITDYETFSGRIEARQSVEIRARVSGYLESIAVADGAAVKKGDLLFKIDPRPYEAELDRAEAEVQRCEARLKRASANVERLRALAARGMAPREEIEKAESDRAEAEAGCRAARAGVKAAQINLEFTRITAPIDGRLGKLALSVGSLVKADTTTLATLASVDPLLVFFDVDERTVLRLAKMRRNKPEAAAAGMPVTIGLTGDPGFPLAGKVDFVEGRLDPARATQRWRAVMANARGDILPGMAARVRLPIGEPYTALLIPQKAIGMERAGPFVFVVNGKEEVERRAVVLGQTDGELRVIRTGLTATDRVLATPKGVQIGESVKPKPIDPTKPSDKK